MITVGWIGLGRLGLPLAISYARAGVGVVAYDQKYPDLASLDSHPSISYERGGAEYLTAPVNLVLHHDRVFSNRVIFLVLPTPGSDLDPTALFEFLYGLQGSGWIGSLVVVSTVLPGECRRLSRYLGSGQRLYHISSYAGMGSVLADEALHKDIVIGSLDGKVDEYLATVLGVRYGDGWRHRARIVSYETSELAKLAVNVVASLKVGFSNDMTRLCHRIEGADADTVLGIVARDQRASSGRYIGVGMADGGGCHPREVEALKRLDDRPKESTFSAASLSRDTYNSWLAGTCSLGSGRVLVWGLGFKDGVPITDGSSAVQVAARLQEFGLDVRQYDPLAMLGRTTAGDKVEEFIQQPLTVLLATDFGFSAIASHLPSGSVVIDATRAGPLDLSLSDGVKYLRAGRGPV